MIDTSKIFVKHEPPTDDDIKRVIERIEKRLSEKAINKYVNFAVKEGYERAIRILNNETKDVSDLNTTQGRCIADLANDYLNCLCSEDILCNVPIKR